MPLDATRVGIEPKESPMITHAALTWTMNFAAGCREIIPLFADNTHARVPVVHPLFLASCSEIIGAWGCLYAAGVTKPEVIKHTFVHWKFDSVFHRLLSSDETVTTRITLAGIGNHRSGGHFSTKFVNMLDRGGGGGGGVLLSESWWDGIVLGLAASGKDCYRDQPPPRLEVTNADHLSSDTSSAVIVATSDTAHVWDACIRNPRQLKAKSADINVHTNVGFAQKAGLPARTVNGLTVLALAVSKLLEMIGHPRAWSLVRRIACTFGAPVYIAYETVELRLIIAESGVSSKKPDDDDAAAPVKVVRFDVVTARGKKAVRDGYLELRSAIPTAKL